MSNNMFLNSFEYKLIYIFEIRDERHKGLIKIGDTTIKTDEVVDKLGPNCKLLNKAAKARIDSYTKTAAINYNLLHTELAIKTINKGNGVFEQRAFRDYDVHRVLEHSGIKKIKIDESTGREWFRLDVETAINAIKAVKNGYNNLSHNTTKKQQPIIFRPEQEDAIRKTLKQFKKGDRMLWNAKMRFGKTLSALEVIKQSNFKKTIIITHRPVVDNGWYEDFKKIFYDKKDYIYGSKNSGYTVKDLLKKNTNFVYFASMQDLRGSNIVGGKFNKNNIIFELDWDFVIVDEAHEGTTTALGNDVINSIVKEGNGYTTKFLALSGTPFNILGDYDDNIYTWDYIMEQSKKKNWDLIEFGDSNPYDELPELQIFTYDIGKILKNGKYIELEDKAFNFKEFFRVWTGNVKLDYKIIPDGIEIGEFCHKEDVWSFLNLITKYNKDSKYPYSTEEYRNLFKHSLWMVPGVKEARALSNMLNKHPVFGSGAFNIVNVAGDGDEEEKSSDALEKVRTAINNAGEDGYTITLSCGKLTTGVTVPEWTAVFMLSGSFSTSASNYLQTIFRVQSPCNKNGKVKRFCYVFDFAPDRTLKMVSESVAISTKAGKTDENDKQIMGRFLNYCPVIAVDGTVMKKYDTNSLLQQLKRAYAERAVKNGFDDNSLYNEQLLKIDKIELDKFKSLEKIVGASKSSSKIKEIDINKQGFTEEEYEKLKRLEKKKKKELTPEEQKLLKKKKEMLQDAAKARSVLRAISIRIPLLIYGMDIDIDEDITMEMLVEKVDDSSWEEFMPKNVTKDLFKYFMKYYDKEVFVAAGRKIRNTIKSAENLSKIERIKKITQLFSYFKNPDKETVLTPWRVVNIHMSDCLGGYDFFDEDHKFMIDIPRYIDKGTITSEIFNNKNAKILEINSKTGLYPLYITYSIFKNKCNRFLNEELTYELEEKIWNETVENNVFIICKTPMAKAITKRTLIGFKNIKINAHYLDDLINVMKNKSSKFKDRISRPNYWGLKGVKEVKFDAIVGNPPYQISDGGAKASAAPIYHYFMKSAKQIKPNYISLITPSRWYVGGKGLDEYRDEMLNDTCIKEIYDWKTPDDIFPNTNIRGGVCYYLWDKEYNNASENIRVVTYQNGKIVQDGFRPLKIEDVDIFIRDNMSISILKKVTSKIICDNTLDKYVSSRKPFGLATTFINDKSYKLSSNECKEPVLCFGKGMKKGYVDKSFIKIKREWIDKWKLYTPYANNIATELNDDNLNTYIGEPNTICTETYLVLGGDYNLTKIECINLQKYTKTKFLRFLHSISKCSQHATAKTYKFIPLQDFSEKSDIDWSNEIENIDIQLFEKYGLTDEEKNHILKSIKVMN